MFSDILFVKTQVLLMEVFIVLTKAKAMCWLFIAKFYLQFKILKL